MAEKRKRGQNFSLEDKDKVVKLLLQHKDTILNKKTDGATNEAKNSAWIAITNSFNSTSNIHRNKESLMKMWEKLKSESKRYYSHMKNNTTQTGRGPIIIKIDPVLELVCSILSRGCTRILGVPDSDAETGLETEKVHVKVICTQNDIWQTAEEANVITIEESKNLETLEEIQKLDTTLPEKTQPQIYQCINIEDTEAEEAKAVKIQELQKQPINKTPQWSRRRPQISSHNERSEATSSVTCSIQNVYKRKKTVEDLKEQILQEELEFKENDMIFNCKQQQKEIEIKTTILDQIKDGGFSFNNSFGIQY